MRGVKKLTAEQLRGCRDVTGGEAVIAHIGPFPVRLPSLNSRLGRKGWDAGSLASEQRAKTRAAMSGYCRGCGSHTTAIRPRGAKWSAAFPVLACSRGPTALDSCRVQRRVPYQLPPHGPEHPVDILVCRVPRRGASNSDAHDNRRTELKAVVDEIAAQLWPKGPDRKPIGTVDDSAPWLRWDYVGRPHRKDKPPSPSRRPPGYLDGPPDPPNEDTELCEIWIAPRDDCRCYCGELRQAARAWEVERRRFGSAYTRAEKTLAEAIARTTEPCGCGRSTLPIRWAQGEL